MSAFKVVRDGAGLCRGCGPNTDAYQPVVPAGGSLELSDVWVDVPPPPLPTPEELEADALAALNGGAKRVDMMKLLKAKFISDLAWRLGKAPGTLTALEIAAERQRIANIYKAL